jgi:DNA-binding NtrC family response regulator
LRVAKTLKPDVVLTDLWMDNMDGIELMKKLRSTMHVPAVIIVSALGDIVAVKEAVRKGECMYLEKPLDKDKVLLNIKQALGSDR